MLARLKALDLLMKFFILALCIIPVLAYLVNTTDSLTTLEKRTLIPPLQLQRNLASISESRLGTSPYFT